MNRILAFVLVGLILASCGSGSSENTMVLTGNVKGLKKGTLYLQRVMDTVLVDIDSLEIAGDGKFSFEADLEDPEVFYLYLKKADNNDINDRIIFFGEPGTVIINTHWNAFDSKAEISGSETHKKLEEYREVMTKFNTENLQIIQRSYDPEIQNDSLVIDSIQKASNRNQVRSYLYTLNFALNNKNSHIAPYIVLTEVADANVKFLDSLYNSLSPEVANAKYGRELAEYLERAKSAE